MADTAPVDYDYPSPTQAEMWDSSGHTVWHYDATGRLLSEAKTIEGQTFATGYGYDAFGRLQTMTYPDGEVVTYGYDQVNQVNNVAGQDVYLANAAYDALGQPTSLTLGNAVGQTIGYDPVTQRPATASASNPALQNLAFDFDNMGRLDWWTDNSQGASQWLNPEYDSFNRLDSIGSNVSLFQQNYDYDTIGNLTNRDGLTLTYSPDDRPHLPGADSAGTGYLYDANGNMTSRTLNSGAIISYTYDAENRLTQVISNTIGGPITTTIRYDGNGQRVLQNGGSGQHRVFLGDHMEGLQNDEGGIDNTWIKLSNDSTYSEHSDIALYENTPYFVWQDWQDAINIMFYRLGEPNITSPVKIITGTFSSPYRIDNSHPSIAIDTTGSLHVAWIRTHSNQVDYQIISVEVYYSNSDDGGLTWSDPEPISTLFDIRDYESGTNLWDYSQSGIHPKVVIGTNNDVHVIWNQLWGERGEPGFGVKLLHRTRLANGIWSDSISILAEDIGIGSIGYNASAGPTSSVYVFFSVLSDQMSYYRIWDSGAWGAPVNYPANPRLTTVDSTGTIHAGRSGENGGVHTISYLYKTDGVDRGQIRKLS